MTDRFEIQHDPDQDLTVIVDRRKRGPHDTGIITLVDMVEIANSLWRDHVYNSLPDWLKFESDWDSGRIMEEKNLQLLGIEK